MGKKRILFIDNRPENIRQPVLRLQLAGYQVDEAPTGREGLERLRSDSYDLVILDSELPNEDGYNAAQFRSYGGWSLHERSSSQIAAATKTKLTWAQLGPGIVMLFSANGGRRPQDVTHVGIYLGNGWMMHSTGGGPQLQWVGDGYYRDHFVWGRRLAS